MFPAANFKQTYGLSELGVLQSASPENGSLWLRVGGQDFETRVVDGILHIKSRSSMLGYLNAASPIDADGWMNTGDMVEEEGDLIKVIGRQSDVINVGGQKVFPVEVEAVLLENPQVAEATVYAIPHPVLGQVVGARLSLLLGIEDSSGVLANIKAHCKSRLQKYKIPMRFELVGLDQHGSERGKKVRR
jgi:acyl-CoA synthetase (AMP-forming)/AMP-acid ligase II